MTVGSTYPGRFYYNAMLCNISRLNHLLRGNYRYIIYILPDCVNRPHTREWNQINLGLIHTLRSAFGYTTYTCACARACVCVIIIRSRLGTMIVNRYTNLMLILLRFSFKNSRKFYYLQYNNFTIQPTLLYAESQFTF